MIQVSCSTVTSEHGVHPPCGLYAIVLYVVTRCKSNACSDVAVLQLLHVDENGLTCMVASMRTCITIYVHVYVHTVFIRLNHR